MSLSRRQFLGRTGLMAGGFLGANLLGNPWTRAALAQTLGDRYFVSLFLAGGNDGLNTVCPVDNGGWGELRAHYEVARTQGSGGLRLAGSDLLVPSGPSLVDASTTTPLGFHPGLTGLANLYSQGKVAVLQGCGYPDPNLSHATSTDIWEAADPLRTGIGTGWLGRHLAQNFGSDEIPALALRKSTAGESRQTATSVLTAYQVRNLSFPYDSRHRFDDQARRDALMSLALSAQDSGQPVEEQVGAANRATLLASESYPGLHDTYEDDRPAFDQAYDDLGSGTASGFREIAKVIYGVERGVPNVEARYFEVRNGGYDTHSNQGGAQTDGAHYRLHREVGDALETFYADCEDMGVADRVCILVWSEFSRRIAQNDTGTDHGTQGPMFVIGGSVQGGLYGNHPNIDEDALENGNTVYSQDDADPFRSIDFRDVYGSLLKHWINVPEATILGTILPPDTGDPALYWTNPQFDLGLL